MLAGWCHSRNLTDAGKTRSGFCDNEACKLRDGSLFIGHTKPFAEIMPKRQAKLFAGLHEVQHGIASHTPISAHGAAGDFTLGDTAAQIFLGHIGVQRDLRKFEHFQ